MKFFRFFLATLIWGLLCHGHAARADVILRGFDPVVPTAGQTAFLVLDTLRFSGITTCEISRTDVPAKVSVQGNLIVLKLYMARIFIGSPFCQTGPSSIGTRWPLESTLPAGTYTVRVFGCAECFGDPPFSPEFLIGELPLTVLGSANVSVPMLGLPTLILFCFAVLLMGVRRFRYTLPGSARLTVNLMLAFVCCTAYAQNNAKPLPQLAVELKPGLDIAALVQSATANNPNASAFSLERPMKRI
jgi:hypothetical protein